MAFLEATVVDSKQRFSLLLLEPGEIFFQDFSVNCYPHGIPESEALKRCQKGRLHICSKSLVFDPKDFSQPILKFSYCDIVSADSWTGSLLTKLGSNDKNFVISTNQTIEMKIHNEIAPYVFKREKKQFLFSLIHSKVEDCLPYISQLLRASTLPRHDQAAMISVIVHSRHSRQKFDSSRLEDVYESIEGQFRVDRVTPLVINPGIIMLTTSRLYFQPFNNISPAKIQLCDIKQVIRRRFILRHTAIEIHCKESRKSNCQQLYLSLQNESECSELYQLILNQNGCYAGESSGLTATSPSGWIDSDCIFAVQLDDPGQENMTLRWQNGIVTNFEYLSYLNDLADRSINDLTQYPVFPWVIADYTSPVLDLQNPATFRDLSKPMGALNPERLVKLLDRFSDMQEPRFLYGSHYSTPAYILFYLIRAAPEYALCLHGGRFDAPDRMFNGISDVFKNCLTNLSDFKELIPEFYNSNGNFLQNLQQINFGITQTNRAVTDVLLPPWADSPQDMIEKFRQALESEYVSNNLHHWIDLIFGYKQRGEEAIAANNLFYHLTYEGSVDLDSIENLEDRSALETQIMEFGQTPKQLFTRPHPCRLVNSNVSPSVPLSVDDINETTDVNDGISQSKSVFRSDNFCCYAEHSLHKDFVTDVKWSRDGQTLFSCSKDSSLKIYSVPVQRQLRSFNICNMPLSSFALMPDEKTVIAGSWDNNIYIYNIESGRLVNQVIAHDDAVSQLSYSNNLLLSGSWDSMITLWGCRYKNRDLNQLELMVQFEHDAGVNCVCQNNDNTRLVSGTKDGHVTFFSPDRPYPISCHKAHSGSVHSLSFSSDCKQLITCGQDGCLKVFDMTTETEVFSKNAGSELRCAVWSDRSVITGTSSGQLLVWDLVRGDILDSLPGHDADVLCLDLTSDKQICSGGMDKKVKMWKQ